MKSASTEIDDGGKATSVNQFSLAPGTSTNYGNLELDNADVLYLTAGTYNINSLNIAKDGQIVITSGPVVLDISGSGFCDSCSSNTVLNSGGNSGYNLCSNHLPGNVGQLDQANCPTTAASGSTVSTTAAGTITGIPSNLQIVYGGTGIIGAIGAPLASTVYAPNATVQMTGAPLAYYGSIIANSSDDKDDSPVHYDNALQNSVYTVGPFKPVGFSRSKF